MLVEILDTLIRIEKNHLLVLLAKSVEDNCLYLSIEYLFEQNNVRAETNTIISRSTVQFIPRMFPSNNVETSQ